MVITSQSSTKSELYSHAESLTTQILVDTAFKQQRLKAWQPILTPKTVLPTFFVIGLLFAPIGALLIWGSGQVSCYELLHLLTLDRGRYLGLRDDL